MALETLISTSSALSQTPLLKTPQNQITSLNKFGCKKFTLCVIDEETVLPTQSPNIPIKQLLANNKSDPKLNANAALFIPSFVNTETGTDSSNTEIQQALPVTTHHKTYTKIERFIPKHAPRAKLNIYIGKPETKRFLSQLHESFPSTSTLYYYLDVSIAFQMNDKQMYIFQTIKEPMISFINFDLHKKHTQELLYGIVIPNNKNRIQKCNTDTANDIKNTKWLWQMDKCLTEEEIYDIYDIERDDLPKSSRKIHKLQEYICMNTKQEEIVVNIVDTIQWSDSHNVQQFGKMVKKSSKMKKLRVELKAKNWIKKCKKSWNDFPAIPIIVFENKDITGFDYWVEWVKLIKLNTKENKSYIGISFKNIAINRNNKIWKLQSVYFDKMQIFKKHRLFGLNSVASKYKDCFDKFDIEITEIQWLP